jgi:hypothetical protein
MLQQEILEHGSKYQVAAEIAAETGWVNRCKFELCDELTLHWDASPQYLKDAYKYAAWLLKNNKLPKQGFKSQQELTDLIKNLENDLCSECECERLLAKD